MEITSKTLYLKNINLTFQKKKIGKKPLKTKFVFFLKKTNYFQKF